MNFIIRKTFSMNRTCRHISVSVLIFLKRSLSYSLHSFLLNAYYVPVPTVDYWCISARCATLCQVDEQTANHLLALFQSCLQTQGQELKSSTWALCATIKYNSISCPMRSPRLALVPTLLPVLTAPGLWELEDIKRSQSPGSFFPKVRQRSPFSVGCFSLIDKPECK